MKVDKRQILWDLRRAEHKKGTSAPTFAVCGRAADYIEELKDEIKNLENIIRANRMEDDLAETYGKRQDVLKSLLEEVGRQLMKEGYLVLAKDRFLTEDERIFEINKYEVLHFGKKGFEHQVVGSFKNNPRRIVYDEEFGCMWYNSEGPEE